MVNKIHEIADNQGMSIIFLSKKSGVARSHLYNIMSQRVNPSMNTAKRIADALGSTIHKLFPTT